MSTGANIRKFRRVARVSCDYCVDKEKICYVGENYDRCALCAEFGRKKSDCEVVSTEYRQLVDEQSTEKTATKSESITSASTSKKSVRIFKRAMPCLTNQ